MRAQNCSSAPEEAAERLSNLRTPRRQFVLGLVGELEVEVSDGEVRRFGPGSVILVEDTSGKGHLSRVVGTERSMAAAIRLADS